jgi:hypothetical protein
MSEKPDLVPRWVDLRPLGLIGLSVALVWSVKITATTWKSVKVKPEIRSIKVVGSAKKRIVSDLIDWEATVTARASDRTAAYKLLREEREKAVAFLVAQGIKESEIQPQSTSFQEEFDTHVEFKMLPGAKEPLRLETKVFKDYLTSEAIIVRSTDVQRVEKASREITNLLEQGVSITSAAPSYFYTRLGELKVEMLAAAGKDARARADNILKSAGGAEIKRLRKTNMGIININPANSTQTSEEGNNDRSSYEKDIITIVHAEFDLDD